MRLDVNQQAFFAIVKAGLWKTEARLLPYDKVDYSELLQLAQEQSVVGLVAAGVNHTDAVPYETKLKFIGLASQIQHHNEVMNRFIAELVQKMQSASITLLLVKGQGVAQCYERPLWRTSGDVDLLLDVENYEKAKAFLSPMAVSVNQEYTSFKHIGLMMPCGIEVELHGTFHSRLSGKVDGFLDTIQDETIKGRKVRIWQNGNVGISIPNPDNDIIFMFTHILHHFYIEGIGLRQFCDLCRLLWTYRDSIDRELLKYRLFAMGLESEWMAVASFAVEYLGMPVEAMPLYSPDKKWKRKARRICSFVLEVGNFGHNRDLSYYNTKPYIIRKAISMGQRCWVLLRHAAIFPIDSLRFFPRIMISGLRNAARGE